MLDHKHIAPFILSSEGGQSSDPRDPAANWYRPKALGAVHTNKGITWPAFQAAFHCNEDPQWIKSFLEMKFETWVQVWETGYWNAVRANDMQTQRIADLIAWWAWGSGAATAIKQTQYVLQGLGNRLSADGVIGTYTLSAINTANQDKLFWAIYEARISYIFNICRTNPKLEVYKQGWINALVHFLKFNDMESAHV